MKYTNDLKPQNPSSLKNWFKVYQKDEKHLEEIVFPANKDILIVFQANVLNSLFHADHVFPRNVNWGINSWLCSIEQMFFLRSPSQISPGLTREMGSVRTCVSVAALNMTLRENLWHFPTGALNYIEEQSHAFWNEKCQQFTLREKVQPDLKPL